MKNNELDELFQSLDFDVAAPSKDHRERFQQKLEDSRPEVKSSGVISLWIPIMSIAASLLLAVIIFPGVFNSPFGQSGELASVSPEMQNTQDFYSAAIQQELATLEKQKSPATKKLVEDALLQLDILERDYEQLKTDLVKSGQDNRVIYAMISNFQQRIDLLNQVLEKINTIKTLKNKPHENNLL